MQTGDLVMFRGSGIGAWIIRFWTRSAWSHCGVLWMTDNNPTVFEARPGRGVVLSYYAERIADKPTLFPTGRSIYFNAAMSLLGGKYSVKDAVRGGVGQAGDHAGWQCAEFAAHLYGLPPNKAWTPQKLIEHLSTGAANECR